MAQKDFSMKPLSKTWNINKYSVVKNKCMRQTKLLSLSLSQYYIYIILIVAASASELDEVGHGASNRTWPLALFTGAFFTGVSEKSDPLEPMFDHLLKMLVFL